MMTLDQLKATIEAIVRDRGFTEVHTEVEKPRLWFHVLISAAEFRGKTMQERENVIWKEFEERLDDETILFISQCYLMTPEEYAETQPLVGS